MRSANAVSRNGVVSTRVLRAFALVVAVAAASLGAGCGGQGQGVAAPPATAVPSVAASAAATETPLPIASAAPFSAETTVPIASGAAQAAVPLPTSSAFSGTLTLNAPKSAVTAGLTVDAVVANRLPAGFPSLQDAFRRPAGVRGALSLPASAVPLVYVTLIYSASVTTSGGALVGTVPASSLLPGVTYYAAYLDPFVTPLAFQLAWAGPATVSGTQVTFALPSGLAFAGRTTYLVILYAQSATDPTPTPLPTATPPGFVATATPTAAPTPTPIPGTPTPSPTPTPAGFVPTATPTPIVTPTPAVTPTPGLTPTPTPTPVGFVPTATPTPTPSPTPTPIGFVPTATPVPTPTPIPTPTPTPVPTPTPTATPLSTGGALDVSPANLILPGSGSSATVTVTANGYSGAITETDSCGGTVPIASFSPTSGSGPLFTTTVKALNAGVCLATFSDARNNFSTIVIRVNTGGFTIQSHGRR